MKVGSLVECQCDFSKYSMPFKVPLKGGIYTVRDIIPCKQGNDGLLLQEIINEPSQLFNGNREPSFGSIKFRELQPPMTISIDEILKEPQHDQTPKHSPLPRW